MALGKATIRISQRLHAVWVRANGKFSGKSNCHCCFLLCFMRGPSGSVSVWRSISPP
ncbi:Uncharacterised protein [Vibrio cholerae]|nr:Uncharacterised protein [Vibrio cholerae]